MEAVAPSKTTVDDSAPEWMTPAEAAKFLGMSLSWINQSRMKGRTGGPPYRKMGKKVAYLREDLLQYIENNKVYPESR